MYDGVDACLEGGWFRGSLGGLFLSRLWLGASRLEIRETVVMGEELMWRGLLILRLTWIKLRSRGRALG
jgi:hypothetical protein